MQPGITQLKTSKKLSTKNEATVNDTQIYQPNKTVEPSTLASINYFRVTTTWNEVSSSIKYPQPSRTGLI